MLHYQKRVLPYEQTPHALGHALLASIEYSPWFVQKSGFILSQESFPSPCRVSLQFLSSSHLFNRSKFISKVEKWQDSKEHILIDIYTVAFVIQPTTIYLLRLTQASEE